MQGGHQETFAGPKKDQRRSQKGEKGRHKEDRRSNDFRRARTGGRRCPQGVDRLSAAPHQESADCKSEEGCGGKNPDQLIAPSEELALVPGAADANDAVEELLFVTASSRDRRCETIREGEEEGR